MLVIVTVVFSVKLGFLFQTHVKKKGGVFMGHATLRHKNDPYECCLLQSEMFLDDEKD